MIDIVTDVPSRLCSFKVTSTDVDFESKLAEFAETNEHLRGYTIQ